jgi:cholesterol transport system auxiliary component
MAAGGVVLSVLVFASGCVSPSRSSTERRYYLLQTTCPEPQAGPPAGPVLKVRRFSVSAAFGRREFVYRTGESAYQTDYYNAFLIGPADVLTDQTHRYLSGAGVFSHVVDSSSNIEAAYAVEGNVDALCGDYRDKAHPKAVLEVQLLLVRTTGAASSVVLERNYRISVLISTGAPAPLVKGWNEALSSVLADFEEKVRESVRQSI